MWRQRAAPGAGVRQRSSPARSSAASHPPACCSSHLIFPPHVPDAKSRWETSFLLGVFCSELLPALPSCKELSREDDSRASRLSPDINKYLLSGINSSFAPQSAVFQPYLYTTFILHCYWELFISRKSCRDAWETFVFNTHVGFDFRGEKPGSLRNGWQSRKTKTQLPSALQWCPERAAEELTHIFSPLFHRSYLPCAFHSCINQYFKFIAFRTSSLEQLQQHKSRGRSSSPLSLLNLGNQIRYITFYLYPPLFY